MTAAVLETEPRANPPLMTAAAPARPLRRSAVPVREPRGASRVTHTSGDHGHVDPSGPLTLLLPLDLLLPLHLPAPIDEPSEPIDGPPELIDELAPIDELDQIDEPVPIDVSHEPAAEQAGHPDPADDGSRLRTTSGREDSTVKARRPLVARRDASPASPPAPGRGAQAGARRRAHGVADRTAGETDADAGPHQAAAKPARDRAEGEAQLSEPRAWAGTFLQAAMEVAVGIRAPAQLVRWTTPEVHGLLVRRGSLAARAQRAGVTGAKPRIRVLLSCVPRYGVCEVAAVVAERERVRAVAFRMEGLHGRWQVTELVIG